MFALSGRRVRRRTAYRFVVVTVVLGILGTAAALKAWSAGDAISPELRELCQAGSNAYYLKSKPCSLHADTPLLERLSHAGDRSIRELATQRLIAEKLLGDFDQAGNNARETINKRLNAVTSDEFMARSLNGWIQEVTKDDSQRRSFKNLMFGGQVHEFHDEAMELHGKTVATAVAGMLADKKFREGVEKLLVERSDDDSVVKRLATTIAPGRIPKGPQGARFRVQNNTGQTLHNCVIVLNVRYNQTMYRPIDVAGEVVMGVVMRQFEFDPTGDAKLSFLLRLHGTLDRGGFAFIDELPAGATAIIEVDSARSFEARAMHAETSISCDEFCFKGRPLSLNAFKGIRQREAAEKKAAKKKRPSSSQ
jgi:hypothetical protein